MRSSTSCSRAPSPSISPRRRTRRAQSPTRLSPGSPALARRFGFLVFADECYCEIYLNGRRRAACWKPRHPISPTSWCSTRSRSAQSAGLRVGFAAGDKSFLTPLRRAAQVAAPQVPVPSQEVAIAAYGDEAHVERTASSMLPSSISPTRSRRPLRLQAPGRRLLPLARRRAQGGDEAATGSSGATAACASFPATISRATAPTASIPARLHPRRTGVRTTRSRPRRCIASSPCSG